MVFLSFSNRIWRPTRRIDARIGARFTPWRPTTFCHISDHGHGDEYGAFNGSSHSIQQLCPGRSHGFWFGFRSSESYGSGHPSPTAPRCPGRLVWYRPLKWLHAKQKSKDLSTTKLLLAYPPRCSSLPLLHWQYRRSSLLHFQWISCMFQNVTCVLVLIPSPAHLSLSSVTVWCSSSSIIDLHFLPSTYFSPYNLVTFRVYVTRNPSSSPPILQNLGDF